MSFDFKPPDKGLVELGSALKQTSYSFTIVSPATHERVNRRNANQWSKNLAEVFGWNRPFHPEDVPPEILVLMDRAAVCIPYENGLKSSVRFSTLDGHLFIHSAFPTIGNDSVFFGPDTYRFANSLKDLFGRGQQFNRIVDIGCDAGPGAVIAALANPQSEVVAVDINPHALDYTRVNAQMAGVEISTVQSDLLTQVGGKFDLIIANPPFIIDPLERAYRHGGGLYGSEFSLRIVENALSRLSPNGTLLLYTGHAIVDNASPFLAAADELPGLQLCDKIFREVDPDIFGEELDGAAYAKVDRIAAMVLEATRR